MTDNELKIRTRTVDLARQIKASRITVRAAFYELALIKFENDSIPQATQSLYELTYQFIDPYSYVRSPMSYVEFLRQVQSVEQSSEREVLEWILS